MNPSPQPDPSLESRLASPLLEVLIRAGLILALALLCYQIFSPFLLLMVWAVILAVTLYPLHQALAHHLGGKQGLAATLVTSKLMYSSDAHCIPELYYLGAKWGREILGEVLAQALQDTDLTAHDVDAVAVAVLRENARALYLGSDREGSSSLAPGPPRLA